MIYLTFLYHDLTNTCIRNADCMPMVVYENCILILLTLKKKSHYFIVWGVFYGTYTVL